MTRKKTIGALLVAISFSSTICTASSEKTIKCPAVRIYTDMREDGAGEQFCKRMLPGSLWVEDGPSDFWFSEGNPGERGDYSLGRKIGPWVECDRFGHCNKQSYPLFNPEEQRPGLKPKEIPVSYNGGKYVFDFASCRQTWITYQTPDTFVELNIGGSTPSGNCEITVIPSTKHDRPDGHAAGRYLCRVPFSVGILSLPSLRLKEEFEKLGQPQFCKTDWSLRKKSR